MTDVSAAPVRPMRELLPHLVWEGVLLLAAIGVTAGLLSANSEVFSRGGAWASFAVLGFVTSGLALSFRTATPNLAVAQIAGVSGWVYASESSVLLALLTALGIGLFLAVVVGLTSLPAWAVSIPVGYFAQFVVLQAGDGKVVALPRDTGSDPISFGLWAAVFIAVSIIGAVVFALPAVRRLLTTTRPAGGEELGTFRATKLLGAAVGLIGSSFLAGAGGVLQVAYVRAASPTLNDLLIYSLAAVLLAGVSVFGRRAGILGVVLAVLIVDFTRRWEALKGAEVQTVVMTISAFALVGLIAIWLLELLGRRWSPLLAPAGPGAGPGGPGFPALPGGAPSWMSPGPGQPPYGSGPAGQPGYGPPPGQPPFAAPSSPAPVSGPPPGAGPGQPGYGAPVSAPPMYPPAGQPAYGPPSSAPPAYGPPASGPPTSAPPAYGPPSSAPPAYGPPGQPGSWPADNPAPGEQPPPPPHSPPPNWPPTP